MALLLIACERHTFNSRIVTAGVVARPRALATPRIFTSSGRTSNGFGARNSQLASISRRPIASRRLSVGTVAHHCLITHAAAVPLWCPQARWMMSRRFLPKRVSFGSRAWSGRVQMQHQHLRHIRNGGNETGRGASWAASGRGTAVVAGRSTRSFGDRR